MVWGMRGRGWRSEGRRWWWGMRGRSEGKEMVWGMRGRRGEEYEGEERVEERVQGREGRTTCKCSKCGFMCHIW